MNLENFPEGLSMNWIGNNGLCAWHIHASSRAQHLSCDRFPCAGAVRNMHAHGPTLYLRCLSILVVDSHVHCAGVIPFPPNQRGQLRGRCHLDFNNCANLGDSNYASRRRTDSWFHFSHSLLFHFSLNSATNNHRLLSLAPVLHFANPYIRMNFEMVCFRTILIIRQKCVSSIRTTLLESYQVGLVDIRRINSVDIYRFFGFPAKFFRIRDKTYKTK